MEIKDLSDTEESQEEKEASNYHEEEPSILEEESPDMDEMVSKKIAAIEAHKRSRTTMVVCIAGIAGCVISTIFVSISVWAGAAAACVFSGLFGMLGVRAIKDYKHLEAAYGLGKRK